MTPQFTTLCYVRVDDPIKRNEVCLQLNQIGYKNISVMDYVWIITQATDNKSEYLAEYMKMAINCGTNTDLFLALAARRSDTDKGQWFICTKATLTNNVGDMEKCIINKLDDHNYRKATAQEIVEHFKTKEK